MNHSSEISLKSLYESHNNSKRPSLGRISESQNFLSENTSKPNKIIFKKQNRYRLVIERRLQFMKWIASYNRSTAAADFIAGITVGLTMIPQSIAYASLAGLPSHYGLYSTFMGSFVYVLFGSVKEASIGPTSLMALLTLQYTIDKPIEFVIILTLFSGFVEFLMGAINLGFIVDFISMPVTSAFTTATSIIIIGTEMENLIGLSYTTADFKDTIYELFTTLNEIKLCDTVLGVSCIISLLLFRFLKDLPAIDKFQCSDKLKKIAWYISISRNAIIVLVTSFIAFYWSSTHSDIDIPFQLSGIAETGIPKLSFPSFAIQNANTTLSFVDICKELGSGIIIVPIVAVMTNVAIAKSFTTNGIVDASQEMIALGICNMMGSLAGSMPTCGAFTRSAVSQTSGVRTPMAGFYSAVMALLALTWLTPYFHFIPRSTLSAVLICAVMFMIDFRIVLRLWRENKRDLFAWVGCFTICLALGVEYGLLVGIILNSIHLLHMWARPKILIKVYEIENIQYIRVTPNVGMFFPGIDNLRAKVYNTAASADFKVPVVIDCGKFSGLDYTSARGITNLAEDLNKQKMVLIIQNLDSTLEKYIDTAQHDILFCNKEETLIELLTQESIRNGTIPLMQHIRASIDLGYHVDPLITIIPENSNKFRNNNNNNNNNNNETDETNLSDDF